MQRTELKKSNASLGDKFIIGFALTVGVIYTSLLIYAYFS